MMRKTAQRPSKDQYYLNIAREVSKRATCMRAHFGCIIVKDDQIISTGYVGAPRKTKDCLERGNCLRQQLHIPSGQQYELCRSVHAEQNAIINAARAGVSLLGGNMYLYGVKIVDGKEYQTFAYPCFICKKMIINAGIKKFIGHNEQGEMIVHDVEQWALDWAESDMIDDKQKYTGSYIVPHTS